MRWASDRFCFPSPRHADERGGGGGRGGKTPIAGREGGGSMFFSLAEGEGKLSWMGVARKKRGKKKSRRINPATLTVAGA